MAIEQNAKLPPVAKPKLVPYWALYIAAVPGTTFLIALLELPVITMAILIVFAVGGYLLVRDAVNFWDGSEAGPFLLFEFWLPRFANWAAPNSGLFNRLFRVVHGVLTLTGFGVWFVAPIYSRYVG